MDEFQKNEPHREAPGRSSEMSALPPSAHAMAKPHASPKGIGTAIVAVGIILAKFGKAILLWLKFVLPGLKFAKLGLIFSKLFATGGTMLLSMWFYALQWGWAFAAGFVISILIHELGHVYFAWRLGIPVTAPIFIPGMGALILHKSAKNSVWDNALIGIGGPLWGGAAGVFMLMGADYFHSPLLQALAYTTFFLNLFNLIPVMPLDGGWITHAVSPKIWFVGAVVISYLIFSGQIRNPLMFVLLIMALPRMIHDLRHGSSEPGADAVTTEQRWKMGIAYIVLCGTLAWLMGESHLILARP